PSATRHLELGETSGTTHYADQDAIIGISRCSRASPSTKHVAAAWNSGRKHSTLGTTHNSMLLAPPRATVTSANSLQPSTRELCSSERRCTSKLNQCRSFRRSGFMPAPSFFVDQHNAKKP